MAVKRGSYRPAPIAQLDPEAIAAIEARADEEARIVLAWQEAGLSFSDAFTAMYRGEVPPSMMEEMTCRA